MSKFNADDYEYFAVIATAPSGSTAASELIQGLRKLTDRVQELIESEHTVRVFKCVEQEYEVSLKATVVFAT